MKRLVFLTLLVLIAGCQSPLVKPVDTFVNKTAGPELEYYWTMDLAGEKRFVKNKMDLKARALNLKTIRQLVEEAKK